MNGTKWTENNQSSPHFAGPPARANSAARNRVLAPQGGGREPQHLSARRLSASPASSLKRERGEGVSKGEGGGIVQNVTNSNTFATKSGKWTRGPCCPHVAPIYAHLWSVYPQKCLFFANVFTLRSNLLSEGGGWGISFHCFRAVGESGRSHMAPHQLPRRGSLRIHAPPPAPPLSEGRGQNRGGVIAGGRILRSSS